MMLFTIQYVVYIYVVLSIIRSASLNAFPYTLSFRTSHPIISGEVSFLYPIAESWRKKELSWVEPLHSVKCLWPTIPEALCTLHRKEVLVETRCAEPCHSAESLPEPASMRRPPQVCTKYYTSILPWTFLLYPKWLLMTPFTT